MDLSKEVMIGNWVAYETSYIQIVVGDLAVMEKGSQSSIPYEPIPLTVEVLEACRFIYDEALVRWEHKETGFIVEPYTTENLLYDGFFYHRIPGVIFKKLHTLQNFFRIMTGGILTFNPHLLKLKQ